MNGATSSGRPAAAMASSPPATAGPSRPARDETRKRPSSSARAAAKEGSTKSCRTGGSAHPEGVHPTRSTATPRARASRPLVQAGEESTTRRSPPSSAERGIVAGVESGLYVTDLIGFGVDLVSGDYSQGAVGQWIDKGRFAHPVHEVTIAGNLKEMLLEVDAVGRDLVFRGSSASPTLRIRRMTVSGR